MQRDSLGHFTSWRSTACLLEEMMLAMFGVRYYFFKISLECSCWVAWHSDESLVFFFGWLVFKKPAKNLCSWNEKNGFKLYVFSRFPWLVMLGRQVGDSEGPSHPQCEEDTLSYIRKPLRLKSSAHLFFSIFQTSACLHLCWESSNLVDWWSMVYLCCFFRTCYPIFQPAMLVKPGVSAYYSK